MSMVKTMNGCGLTLAVCSAAAWRKASDPRLPVEACQAPHLPPAISGRRGEGQAARANQPYRKEAAGQASQIRRMDQGCHQGPEVRVPTLPRTILHRAAPPQRQARRHLFEVIPCCHIHHFWIHTCPDAAFKAGWLTPAYRGYAPNPNHPQPFTLLPLPPL